MEACSASERYKNSSPTDRGKDKWLRGYLWKGAQSVQVPRTAANAVSEILMVTSKSQPKEVKIHGLHSFPTLSAEGETREGPA